MSIPQYLNNLAVPSLRFKKTTKQIQTSLLTRIAAQQAKQATLREEVSAICKRREIDPEEIYAAGTDEQAIATYSGKMSTPFQNSTRSVLEALQKDVNRLTDLGRKHAKRINGISELQRVVDNVYDGTEREFDLTYAELATLGF